MHLVVMRGYARRIDAQGGNPGFVNWLARGARDLSPGYFALVMATGSSSLLRTVPLRDNRRHPAMAECRAISGALDPDLVADLALPPGTA